MQGSTRSPETGGMRSLDPRTKVVAVVLFILAVNLIPAGAWPVYLVLLALLWSAAVVLHVGMLVLLRRSLVAVPFVLAVVVLPFTTPGAAIYELPGLGWQISREGMTLFLTILCRFFLAVQAAVLLAASTPVSELLWGLRKLGVPTTLVAIIGFMYRYLFVIGEEAGQMIRARAARSAQIPHHRRPSVFWQGRVSGLMVGSLFLRALARSERIYVAMLSRGYDGHPRSMLHLRMVAWDWIVVIGSGLLLALILWGRMA